MFQERGDLQLLAVPCEHAHKCNHDEGMQRGGARLGTLYGNVLLGGSRDLP